MSESSSTRSLSESLKGYGRGLVGGLIFAFGPLYTMEIWWQGFIAQPRILVLATVLTYVILVGYAYYAGLHESNTLVSNLLEAFEAMALGTLVAFIVLTLVGQLTLDLSFRAYVSKLTIEALTCAIGVAVGSAQLGQDPNEGSGDTEVKDFSMIHAAGYSVLGALVIVSAFTPTMEIVVMALEAPYWATLGTMIVTFTMALGVLSYIDFKGADTVSDSIYAGGPLGDAFVTYAIGLVLSALLLWSVGRFQDVGVGAQIAMTVYLAWPATLGAAVGRFLL